MGTVAAIGARHRVAGFALAGVAVHPAATPAEVVRAWRDLPGDVELVIVTEAAAAAIAAEGAGLAGRLTAVLP
jgi:vacuolar-type H+-ATPase subunit F/Vma7